MVETNFPSEFAKMVEGGGGGSAFPVIFFDGEREMDIGNIKIHPKLVYKTFQSMLAQGIGISPNQISIYLIDRNNPNLKNRRKIPVTGKANFAQICREKECCVLVVLKRSRKARSRKGFRAVNEVDDVETTSLKSGLGDNVVLLRRNLQVNYDEQFYDQISQLELENLNQRLQHVVIQRGGNQQFVNSYGLLNNNNNNNDDNKPIRKYFCEECLIGKKEGVVVEFHHCVNDDVVPRGYRGGGAGPIGPIRR